MIAASPEPVLKTMRLSLLWHQNLMAPGPMAKPNVIERSTYREPFNRKDRTGPLTAPWPVHEVQQFWERYLSRQKSLAAVRGRTAWRAQVPLRVAAPLTAVADQDDTAVIAEGFLHPWGATLVLTLTLKGSWAGFVPAAERVVELRCDPCFSLVGEAGIWISLDTVAETGLTRLRSAAAEATEGPVGEPFSILTLTAAKGPTAAFDPTTAAPTQFLQATSAFSPTWKTDVPLSAKEAKVAGLANAPASHLIYGQRRGRAIWSPEHFLAGGGFARPSTLSCHHRNLVLASMQTEALSQFAAATAARIQANVARSAEESAQARHAVETLEGLYLGARSTYRSGSLKAQIAMNGWLNQINLVRLDAGLAQIP
jgi:hypothetical protein